LGVKITFSAADVRRLLLLPNVEAVEGLVRSGALDVAAYTRRGRPLFDADAVRRAAERSFERQERRGP
jgi:hypothetical protein